MYKYNPNKKAYLEALKFAEEHVNLSGMTDKERIVAKDSAMYGWIEGLRYACSLICSNCYDELWNLYDGIVSERLELEDIHQG